MRGIQRADLNQRLQETLGTRGTVVEEVDSTVVPVVVIADISQRTSDAGPVVFCCEQPAGGAGQHSVIQIRNPLESGFDLVVEGVAFQNDQSSAWVQRITTNADLATLVTTHGIVDGRPSTTGSDPPTPFVLSRGTQGAAPAGTIKLLNNAGLLNELSTALIWPKSGWRIRPGQAFTLVGGQPVNILGAEIVGRMEPLT